MDLSFKLKIARRQAESSKLRNLYALGDLEVLFG